MTGQKSAVTLLLFRASAGPAPNTELVYLSELFG